MFWRGRTLDQLYWDTHCDSDCGCVSLKEALARHPELRQDRDAIADSKVEERDERAD